MGMRQEDVSGERAVALLHQLMAQRTQSAAGIENDQPVVGSGNADAGGITAIAGGLGPGVGIEPRVPQNVTSCATRDYRQR